MRHKIVAGNWKMNNNAAETAVLINDLVSQLPSGKEAEIIIAPSFVQLTQALYMLENTNITVAAQNMHQQEKGAYTGEISADMLTSIGIQTVILGHSERRAYFGETDAILAEKVNTALQNEMRIIFCVGEELSQRQQNEHFTSILSQLEKGLFHTNASAWEQIVIAYEPVWAIGTGETATAQQAQDMHAYIRQCIAKQYGAAIAEQVSILYGGSVKPDNASELFSQTDVDGGLIGGAALKASDFAAIVTAI